MHAVSTVFVYGWVIGYRLQRLSPCKVYASVLATNLLVFQIIFTKAEVIMLTGSLDKFRNVESIAATLNKIIAIEN